MISKETKLSPKEIKERDRKEKFALKNCHDFAEKKVFEAQGLKNVYERDDKELLRDEHQLLQKYIDYIRFEVQNDQQLLRICRPLSAARKRRVDKPELYKDTEMAMDSKTRKILAPEVPPISWAKKIFFGGVCPALFFGYFGARPAPTSVPSTVWNLVKGIATSFSVGLFLDSFKGVFPGFTAVDWAVSLFWLTKAGAALNSRFLGIKSSNIWVDRMVTFFVSCILSVSPLGVVMAKQLFPPTSDARLIQAITDHSMNEYYRLVTQSSGDERETVEYTNEYTNE